MSWVTNTIVLAISRLDAEELVLQPGPGDRVDRAERLVHQQHRRVRGERAGDADPLALTAGELRGVAAAVRARVEPDQLEQLVDPRLRLVAVPAEQVRDRRDVRADRLVREEADLLDHVAHAAPQLDGLRVGHVLVVEEDAPAASAR